MQNYLFVGSVPTFYLLWEGHSFTAEPGEIREFETPPTDGHWVPVPSKAAKAARNPSDSGE